MRQGSTRQLELSFRNRWGGRRRNAGRKRAAYSKTPHRARPFHRAGEPVHVTLKARLAVLRSQFVFPTLRLAVSRAARRDAERFRVVHFSAQRDHVHLLVEAADARALSSGIRGLAVRIARYVNDLLGRRGSFWADRWHGRALSTPREVRHALVYVLTNFRKHSRRQVRPGLDPYSSAAWFDGWREWQPGSGVPPPLAEPIRWIVNTRQSEDINEPPEPVVRARTWLAAVGWKRHGLLQLGEGPLTAKPRCPATAPERGTAPRRGADR